MKTSRAILFMLAGLAGGTGVRLAFSLPAEQEEPRQRRGRNVSAPRSAESTAPPAAAAARPQEQEILTAFKGARCRLLMAWLPGAGAEELLSMADELHRSDPRDDLAVRLLMIRWAEVNPRAMLDWACAKSGGHYNTDPRIQHAIREWARLDFDSAWAAAGSGQPGARGSALEGLAASDPDKCLRLLGTDPKLLDLSGLDRIESMVRKVAAHDPAGFAAVLDKAAPAQRRVYAGQAALEWVKKDPVAALAWIKTLEPGLRETSLRDAGSWIATQAPEHLPALLENVPGGSIRTAIENFATVHLAATDPEAARHRLEAMPAGPARQHARGWMVYDLLERGDDAGAAAIASQLGWTFKDEWSPSWTPGADRHHPSAGEAELLRGTMHKLFDRIAARDPGEAAALLAQHFDERQYAELLREGPPPRPGALAEALTAAGDEKSLKHLETLGNKWMARDPVAAMTWAEAHGPALKSFMHLWDSPEAALQWAATLPPEKRQPLLQDAIKEWRKWGPSMVGDAIRSSSLPEAEKKQLLQPSLPSLR